MVSFKIAKSGSRYNVKPPSPYYSRSDFKLEVSAALKTSKSWDDQGYANTSGEYISGSTHISVMKQRLMSLDRPTCHLSKRKLEEYEQSEPKTKKYILGLFQSQKRLESSMPVSFALNLFQDGFTVGKPTEMGKPWPLGFEVMHNVYPYDRTTADFISDIDSGWIPQILLDEIPCKFVDGCIVCELRDYRNAIPLEAKDSWCSSTGIGTNGTQAWVPSVQKIKLRPTSEALLSDIAAMTDETWTYSDLLDIEAKILRAVQPPVCLQPTVEVAKKAYIINYNKMKFNVGRLTFRRYRMPKEAQAVRRQRIEAAANAGAKSEGLSGAKSMDVMHRKSFVRELDVKPRSTSVVDATSESRGLEQPHVQRGLQEETSLGMSELICPRGLMSGATLPVSLLPSLQAHSSPSPCAPATPSTITSANESIGFVGGLKVGSASLVGERDSIDLAVIARAESKRSKTVQTKQQKSQPIPDVNNSTEVQKTRKIQQQQTKLDNLRSAETIGVIQHMGFQAQRTFQETGSQSDIQASGASDPDTIDSKLSDMEVSKPLVDGDREIVPVETFRLGRVGVVKFEPKEEYGNHELLFQPDQKDQQQPQAPRTTQQARHQTCVFSQGWQQPSLFCETKVSSDGENEMRQEEEMVRWKLHQTLPQKPGQVHSAGLLKAASMNLSGLPGLPSVGSVGSPLVPVSPGSRPKSPAHLATSFSCSTGQVDQLLSSQTQAQLLGAPHSLSAAYTLRKQSSSLPKLPAAASPTITNSLPSLMHNTRATVSTSPCSSRVSGQLGVPAAAGTFVHGASGIGVKQQNVDSLTALLDTIHRNQLHIKKRQKVELPPPSKNPPSFQLLEAALVESVSIEDGLDLKGRKSMANSLVGGNINSRKTRCLLFTKNEQINQDTRVEAVVQLGTDQDDESHPLGASPHHVLPAISNTEKADLFAAQFACSMEREGWELADDQVHVSLPRGAQAMTASAASNARPMQAGASTLTTATHTGSSPRGFMSQQHISGMLGTGGASVLSQIQPSSPNALAVVRMPPPSNTTRQMMTHMMGQPVATKGPQIDAAAPQLALAHQHQQHQIHHQLHHHHHQPQLQQHQQSTRSPQLVPNQQLVAQLTGHQNSGHGLSPQIVPHQSQQMLQLQMMQHQRTQQPQHQNTLQRKMILPTGLGNLGMSMNGVSSMSGINGVGIPVSGGQGGLQNIVGLGGMTGISGVVGIGGSMGGMGMTGVTPSIGGMSGLPNMSQLSGMSGVGQPVGVASILSPQLRSTNLGQVQVPAQAQAALTKARVGGGRTRSSNTPVSQVRGAVDNLSSLPAPSQINGNPVQMMTQTLSRNGLQSLQRGPISGMVPPKVGATGITPSANGQNYFMNSQQVNTGILGSLVGGPPSPQMNPQGTLGALAGITSLGMETQIASRASSAVSAANRGMVRRPLMASQSQPGQP